jgi:hypothetical protein
VGEMKETFKVGDWVKTGNERPMKIDNEKIAKMCNILQYLSSSEKEQKQYDERYKQKIYKNGV